MNSITITIGDAEIKNDTDVGGYDDHAQLHQDHIYSGVIT